MGWALSCRWKAQPTPTSMFNKKSRMFCLSLYLLCPLRDAFVDDDGVYDGDDCDDAFVDLIHL